MARDMEKALREIAEAIKDNEAVTGVVVKITLKPSKADAKESG